MSGVPPPAIATPDRHAERVLWPAERFSDSPARAVIFTGRLSTTHSPTQLVPWPRVTPVNRSSVLIKFRGGEPFAWELLGAFLGLATNFIIPAAPLTAGERSGAARGCSIMVIPQPGSRLNGYPVFLRLSLYRTLRNVLNVTRYNKGWRQKGSESSGPVFPVRLLAVVRLRPLLARESRPIRSLCGTTYS